MKKWHLYIKSVSKCPKTHFLVILLAKNALFMVPKNLQLGFIILELPNINQIRWKKNHFFIRNVRNVPKTHFWVLLWALWGQNPIFIEPQIEFYHVRSTSYIIKSNRSNAKMALLYTKCQINSACVPFVKFWHGTIPKLFFF